MEPRWLGTLPVVRELTREVADVLPCVRSPGREEEQDHAGEAESRCHRRRILPFETRADLGS
jgi:hypothetical protein